MSAAASPVSADMCACALATVAEQQTNRTSRAPYKASSRRSRRITIATCEPKAPVYTCASSMTTIVTCERSAAHSECARSTLACSMSGLVRMACARAATVGRSTRGVSPSSVAQSMWAQLASAAACIARSWSCASAFVGKSSSARACASAATFETIGSSRCRASGACARRERPGPRAGARIGIRCGERRARRVRRRTSPAPSRATAARDAPRGRARTARGQSRLGSLAALAETRRKCRRARGRPHATMRARRPSTRQRWQTRRTTRSRPPHTRSYAHTRP
eukprot:1155871-Pleurochrysis_carterae.AAC.4